MDKPEKQVIEYYDYHECESYLSKLYPLIMKKNDKFWDWIVNRYEIYNGAIINLSTEFLEDYQIDYNVDDKILNIYNVFIKEFAENGEVNFEVSW